MHQQDQRRSSINFRDPLAIGLFVVTLIVYWLSHQGEGAHFNYHVLLADAFLHGRLDFGQNYPWLEIVSFKDKFYTVFPPGPAILITPLVWLFGSGLDGTSGFYQPYFSIFVGALNISLSYFAIEILTAKKGIAFWTAFLYAFGSIHWYHAEVGSGWYTSHVVAMFFVWVALLAALTRKSYFWVGLALGGAYLARLPVVMSVFFFAVFFIQDFFEFKNGRLKIHFKNGLLLSAGLAPALLTNVAYNYLRWEVPYDLGYDLLPIHNEPWYVYGLFSVKYIPIHLKEMFLSIPTFSSHPPYVTPSLFALSILLVTPALLLILRAPIFERTYFAAFTAVLMLAFPSLAHGGNGFTQFGYRHTLDYMPFLLVLVAGGMQRVPKWLTGILIFLSVLVNAWGVVMISYMKLYDMSTRTLLDLL